MNYKERYIRKNKREPWYKHWKSGRQRCNDKKASNYKYYGAKGIQFLLIQEEVKKLWFESCSWRFKEAQLSRKNHNKDYTYNNCYFLEKKVNVSERNNRVLSKPIYQLDLNENILVEWPSIQCAFDKLNINKCHINACALNRLHCKTAGGFKWQYLIKKGNNN
jgi:hypothetical protein